MTKGLSLPSYEKCACVEADCRPAARFVEGFIGHPAQPGNKPPAKSFKVKEIV